MFTIPPEHEYLPYNTRVLQELHDEPIEFLTPVKRDQEFTPIAQEQMQSFVQSSVRPSVAIKPAHISSEESLHNSIDQHI